MKVSTQLHPNEQLIHLVKEFVDVINIDENGIVQKKKISHEDFINVLSSSVLKESLNEFYMTDYELGTNIIRFKQSDKGFIYYFLVRAGKYPFNNEGKKMKIHYPNLIFKLGINESKEVRKTSIFCIKNEDIKIRNSFGVESIFIEPETRLYKYPYGNVGDYGTVCWGGNIFPSIENYVNLHEMIYSFMESPTNTDYTKGAFKEPNTRKALLDRFQTEPFDETLLFETELTYKEI